MELPGRVYLRASDISSPDHRLFIDNWTREYDKTRKRLIFPEGVVRWLAGVLFFLGTVNVVLQVALTSTRHSFYAPRFGLLGSSLWTGSLCIAAGIVGLIAAKKRNNSLLLDFMTLNIIISMLSALSIVLNGITLEIYHKLCLSEIPHTGRENWQEVCGRTSSALQSALIGINVLLFIVSAGCSAFALRVLNFYSGVQVPPIVVYCDQQHVTRASVSS